MRKRLLRRSNSFLVAFMACCCASAHAAEHQFDFTSRIRYAELDVGENDGKAGSVLLRLSLESEWSDQVTSFVEVDHVESAFIDEHSDGVRLNGQPTIPDVEGTEINQAFLNFETNTWSLLLGRQSIELDNQRFVGGNSFWQNEQTFDAARLNYKILSGSNVNYAYIDNVNRIFGDDADRQLNPADVGFETLNGIRPAAQLGDHSHSTHLFRIELNEWDYSQLTAFAYFIDNEDLPAVSNETVGIHYVAKYKPRRILYRLEIDAAIQQRPELANVDNIPYYRLDAGLGLRSVEFSFQQEILGSRKNTAFTTPLGSLHEFNGWADTFSAAPSGGFIDRSVKVKWRKAPWKFDVRYHDFHLHDTSESLGTEIDFDITYRLNKKQNVLLRFADFRAARSQENAIADVRRVIFNYSYNF